MKDNLLPEYSNIRKLELLPSPQELKKKLPISDESRQTVLKGIEDIHTILQKEEPRLLVVCGPCSIHDYFVTLDYANHLNELRKKYEHALCIVMRTYFEKPRTSVGWKGFINDPHLDETYDLPVGLERSRQMLLEITAMGLPCATEFVDPFVPAYLMDLISWAAIGARTTESQTHRAMASGLPMPIGFKNNSEGNIEVAVQGMQAARQPQILFGLNEDGKASLIRTCGNTWSHLVLRGSKSGQNYAKEHISNTLSILRKYSFPTTIMVDCSHGNSQKQFNNQENAWKSVVNQRLEGNLSLIGLMLESNIHAGKQDIPAELSQLEYGISITDGCIDLQKTEELFKYAEEYWVRKHPQSWIKKN